MGPRLGVPKQAYGMSHGKHPGGLRKENCAIYNA